MTGAERLALGLVALGLAWLLAHQLAWILHT